MRIIARENILRRILRSRILNVMNSNVLITAHVCHTTKYATVFNTAKTTAMKTGIVVCIIVNVSYAIKTVHVKNTFSEKFNKISKVFLALKIS